MNKSWWKEGIVYQVYPRSFKDTTGSGTGDLRGVISKLDYLKQLGITIIWLNPVYSSPNDDNGYDISDYQNIHSDFGTLSDLNELVTQLHARNMKLVMDLVVNHCSDEHPWFIDASHSKDSEFRDFFFWREGQNNSPPNNWLSVFGGSAWEKHELTNSYYLHLFSKKQPDLNWDNTKLRHQIYTMMNWWFDRGIDGFRMDVINMISKDPKLPSVSDSTSDELAWGGKYFMNGPKLHLYLQEMHQNVLSHRDVMTVGECFDISVEQGRALVDEDRHELNMLFQMEHMSLDHGPGGKWDIKEIWSRDELKNILGKWINALAEKGWCSQFWMNHDQPRSVSRFGNDKQYRTQSAKALASITLTLPGTPYVYQGEEIGMTNVSYPLSEYRDIETTNWIKEQKLLGRGDQDILKSIHAMSRDNSRTPMQWNSDHESGFTEGKPWLKVNPNYQEINVASAQADPDSIWYFYQSVIQLRKTYLGLIYGDFNFLNVVNRNVFAFERRWSHQVIQVWVNLSDDHVKEVIPEQLILLENNYSDRINNVLLPWQSLIGILPNDTASR